MLKKISNIVRLKIPRKRYIDPEYENKGAKTTAEIDLFWKDEQRVKDYLIRERLDFFVEVAGKIPYNNKIKSVIDIGCGSGHILYHYSRSHNIPENQLVANEISIYALIQVHKLLPEANLIHADLLSLPKILNHTFDLAIATEIMEHLEKPEKYLPALIDILKIGGIALITIPDGDIDNWEGHANFWNENQFKEFLGQFSHIKIKHFERVTSSDLLFIIEKVK